MSAVERAVAEGVDPLRLVVAAHEVAHGLVWRAGGFPAGPAELETRFFGGLSAGGCPHNARGRVTDRNIEDFLLGYAAGTAAQKRCAREYLRGRHARNGSCSDDRAGFKRMNRSWSAAQRRSLRRISTRELDELTVKLARTGRVSLG